MTPARRSALEYFARQPGKAGVAWFGHDAPGEAMRRRMEKEGQLERILPPGGAGMIRFGLTDKGLKDLEDSAT